MSTLPHPAIKSLLHERRHELLEDWLDEDIFGAAGLLRFRTSEPEPEAPVMRDFGRRILALHTGQGIPFLVEWLSSGGMEVYPEETVLHAAQLLNGRVRRAVSECKRDDPEAFEGSTTVAWANSDAVVRGIVEVFLRRSWADQAWMGGGIHNIASLLKDTFFSTLASGVVRFVSPNVEELTGYGAPAFLRNRNLLLNLVLPQDRPLLNELITEVLEGEGVCQREYRLRHFKTGEIRHILHRASPVVIDGTVVRIDSVLVDATERHELEVRLERSEHLRSMGQLAGGIAHDFKNLLVSILGYADLILARAELNGKDAAALELITAAAERGAELTERLLTFSRGASSSIKNPTRLEKLLQDTIALIGPSVPPSICLVYRDEPDVPVVVANTGQIGEAVLNLALNAVQACEAGGGDRVDVILRPARPEEALRIGVERGCTIEVTDNGPGMSSDTRARVFEPLFTTRGDHGGTGLGCSMAYGVAMDHRGTIEVTSTVGSGTTFCMIVPAAPRDARPVRRGRRIMKTPVARRRSGHHVLIADDEESVRELITEVLEEAGYQVTAVASGKEVIDVVTSDPIRFDVVILDVMMQPIDGTEAFIRLDEVAPSLPRIFCTGNSDSTRVFAPDALTRAPVVNKPFRPADLVETVKQNLRRRV